jgi:hypothetical protein
LPSLLSLPLPLLVDTVTAAAAAVEVAAEVDCPSHAVTATAAPEPKYGAMACLKSETKVGVVMARVIPVKAASRAVYVLMRWLMTVRRFTAVFLDASVHVYLITKVPGVTGEYGAASASAA